MEHTQHRGEMKADSQRRFSWILRGCVIVIFLVFISLQCLKPPGGPSTVETPPVTTLTVALVTRDWATVDKEVLAGFAAYGDRHILLIGDSITDLNPLTMLCGWPIIKAGYGGAKWADVAARPIWSQIRSRVAVVQLGTNDAQVNHVPTPTDLHTFLDSLSVGQLFIETIPPFFGGWITPERLQAREAINATIQGLGQQVIDSQQVMNDPSLYLDQLHWNALGYAKQTALLTDAVCRWVTIYIWEEYLLSLLPRWIVS